MTVPSVEQEAARDLVRAREDVRGDLMSARHRLSKLLLRQGIVYSSGAPWTALHDRWLRAQRRESVFDTPGLGAALPPLSRLHASRGAEGSNCSLAADCGERGETGGSHRRKECGD